MPNEEGDALLVMLGNDDLEKSKDSDGANVPRKYGDEWAELCHLAERGLPDIQTHAVHMQLQGSRLRSLYWQLLLGSLPTSPSLWISILRQQRNSYRLLHQRLSVDPHRANCNDNPLSQSTGSFWHQYFCDKELRALIRQDVVRTSPSVEFFRSESIQSTMVNILFCYAREHPEICYRQGMHEVLAPLLFVMQSDQHSLLRARELASVSDRAAEILDPAWLEEDAYWLFSKLMSHLAGNYRVKNVAPLATGHFPPNAGVFHPSVVAETELAARLNHIRDDLLSCFDKELYQHLKSLDIPFQAFGIRWLRLLFAQEFVLQELLYLWDAVFAEGDGLVNYIVVSMLSAIRDQLIVEDDTECLMLLMRYPSGVEVRTVVENALHMWKPKKYTFKKESCGSKEHSGTVIVQKKPSASTISWRLKKFGLWSQKKDLAPITQPYIAPVPVYVAPFEKSTRRLDKGDGTHNVVEGFTLHDPKVARAELRHLHNLLFHVHSHLEQYHATLEHTLPLNTPPAGRAALDGIKQLCAQLSRSLPVSKPMEVEAASEAQPVPRMGSLADNRNPPHDSTDRPQFLDCELKELKNYHGHNIISCFPLNEPLRALCLSHSWERETSLHTSYCRVLGTCVI